MWGRHNLSEEERDSAWAFLLQRQDLVGAAGMLGGAQGQGGNKEDTLQRHQG